MSSSHKGHIITHDAKGNFCLTCQEPVTDAIDVVDSKQEQEDETPPGTVGTVEGSEPAVERAAWGKKLAAKEKGAAS